MEKVILVIHLILAISLIITVLLQRSEGGGLGIGGGGGGGGMGGFLTGRGQANLLTRTTAILAACFIATSLTLTLLASGGREGSSITEELTRDQPTQEAPAEPDRPTVPVQ